MEFVSGQRAVAVKTVSISDEPLDHYMPGFPIMPCSLIIEGLAQTGGILVSQSRGFEDRVVLAKASRVVIHRVAVPGDRMTYHAEIVNVGPEGAMVRATSRIDDALHAEVDLFFAFLGEQVVAGALIPPADLLVLLRAYGLYDVGKTANGDPISVPQHLLDAERKRYA
jgi:3-hydroxyacyl-[acyl-carrier-protein] dehydratase